MGQSYLEWAKNVLAQDSGDTDRALLVLQDAGDTDLALLVLQDAIRIILRDKGEEKAIDLLEKFYTCTIECAWPTRRASRNISMLLGNRKYVKTVATLFEEVLKASKFYYFVARKYQLFIVILMCFVGHGAHEDAHFVILRSLVFKYSSDAVKEAAALLMSTFSTDQKLRRRGHISHSAFSSLRVWVAEAIRIIAKKIDGAVALEELGVNPQRAIDMLTKLEHFEENLPEMPPAFSGKGL